MNMMNACGYFARSAARRELYFSFCKAFVTSAHRSISFAMSSDLFKPHEKLISIEILGRGVFVPENNSLLRCFQFLSLRTISYGDFCWNGECTNCEIWYHDAGETGQDDRPALACRLTVRENMVITKLSGFVELEGINV